MKCYLRDKGLIKRAPGDGKWRTSMDLWCHVIDHASDGERIGVEATGQQLLLEDPVTSSRATRYLRETRGRRGRARHTTLNGDTVDPRESLNWPGVRENQMKDATRATTKAEKAAEKVGQVTLSLAADYARDAWDVNVPWFRGNAVRVPAGQVY